MNPTIEHMTQEWIAERIESAANQHWALPPCTVGLSAAIGISDTSSNGHWRALPNPTAGLREAEWLNEHRDEVADEHHPWVAILGDAIVARGD